jgi:hypothetical protein
MTEADFKEFEITAGRKNSVLETTIGSGSERQLELEYEKCLFRPIMHKNSHLNGVLRAKLPNLICTQHDNMI